MSVYKLQNNTWVWTEQHTSTTLSASLYGADRIGVEKIVVDNITTVEVPVYVDCPGPPGTISMPCLAGDMLVTTVYYSYTGVKHYELTNHLGNVMVVVTDQTYTEGLVVLPTVVSATDYFSFGMEMVGRSFSSETYGFGFNGQYAEKDSETGLLSFDLRALDVRLGRWTSIDPYNQHASPYVSMGNNPILNNDPDGGKDIYYSNNGYCSTTENNNWFHNLVHGKRYYWGGEKVSRKRFEGLMDMAWYNVNKLNATSFDPEMVSANAPMMWQSSPRNPNAASQIKTSLIASSPSTNTTALKILYETVDGAYITAQKYTTAHGQRKAKHMDGSTANYDEAVFAWIGTASLGLPAVKSIASAKPGPIILYRGENSAQTVFKSYAARKGGYAYSKSLIKNGNLDDLFQSHAFDSMDPASPFISTTSNPKIARHFAGPNGIVYKFEIPYERATFNRFNTYEIPSIGPEAEYLVPNYIRPSEIIGRL
jgi:RHS repeat-associated protein